MNRVVRDFSTANRVAAYMESGPKAGILYVVIIFFLSYYSSADLYGRFLINCRSDYNETVYDIDTAFLMSDRKTIDLDLHGVKVVVLH